MIFCTVGLTCTWVCGFWFIRSAKVEDVSSCIVIQLKSLKPLIIQVEICKTYNEQYSYTPTLSGMTIYIFNNCVYIHII